MDRKITIRLSDKEYDILENYSKKLNKNKSETIRTILRLNNSKGNLYIENNVIHWEVTRKIEN